jgi:hypothetical protein
MKSPLIDFTNGHFIHAGPLEGIGVSIYLKSPPPQEVASRALT